MYTHCACSCTSIVLLYQITVPLQLLHWFCYPITLVQYSVVLLACPMRCPNPENCIWPYASVRWVSVSLELSHGAGPFCC